MAFLVANFQPFGSPETTGSNLNFWAHTPNPPRGHDCMQHLPHPLCCELYLLYSPSSIAVSHQCLHLQCQIRRFIIARVSLCAPNAILVTRVGKTPSPERCPWPEGSGSSLVSRRCVCVCVCTCMCVCVYVCVWVYAVLCNVKPCSQKT